MGRVHVNFTNAEVKAGESKIVKGRLMHKLNYDIEVDLFSDRGDLQFRAVVNGVKKESADISFDGSYDMMDDH
jgi:hypothetical protein